VPGVTSNNFGPRPANHEGKSETIPNGVYYELKKLYYECAHASYPMPMAALMKLVGPSQLLFGTDYPAEPMETTLDNLPSDDLSPEVLRGMARGNAERLFPRLKSKT
jgi:predicted TIM-barrel fold metal-dependent hydrolase